MPGNAGQFNLVSSIMNGDCHLLAYPGCRVLNQGSNELLHVSATRNPGTSSYFLLIIRYAAMAAP